MINWTSPPPPPPHNIPHPPPHHNSHVPPPPRGNVPPPPPQQGQTPGGYGQPYAIYPSQRPSPYILRSRQGPAVSSYGVRSPSHRQMRTVPPQPTHADALTQLGLEILQTGADLKSDCSSSESQILNTFGGVAKTASTPAEEIGLSDMQRSISLCKNYGELEELLNKYNRQVSLRFGETDNSKRLRIQLLATVLLALSYLIVGDLRSHSNTDDQTTQGDTASQTSNQRFLKMLTDLIELMKKNLIIIGYEEIVDILKALENAQIRDLTFYRFLMSTFRGVKESIPLVHLCDALQSVSKGLELQERFTDDPTVHTKSRSQSFGHVSSSTRTNTALQRSRVTASSTWGSRLNGSSNSKTGGITMTSHERTFLTFITANIITHNDDICKLEPFRIASLIRLFAKFGHKDLEVLRHLGQAALKMQKRFSTNDWTACVKLFIRFGVPLRDDCVPKKRPMITTDWQRPRPPKKPLPMSQCQ